MSSLFRNSSRSSGASRLLLIAALVSLAAGARAGEEDSWVIRPDVLIQQGWDSNIFNSDKVTVLRAETALDPNDPNDTVLGNCPAGTKVDPKNRLLCVGDAEQDSLVTYIRPSL